MAFRWLAAASFSADLRPFAPLSAASVEGTRSPSGKKRPRDPDKQERGSDDDENFDPEDDSDLGLSGSDDDERDDERIGLDTSTGFEETPDDLGLSEREEDEDERWSVDSEEAGDLADAEPDLFPGEEYGWLGDDEAGSDSDEDEPFDSDLDEDDDAPGDDGGAEGVEDESDLDDLELSELPELDADAEEDAGNSVEGLDELGGLALIDEPSLEISAGEVWKMLPTRAVRVSRIAAPAAPISSLLAHGRSLFVAAAGLYRLSPAASELLALPLPAAGSPSSLALAEHDGELCLAVVASGRVYVSDDGGQHFVERPTGGVARAFFTRSASGPRLWWRTTRAELGSDRGQGSLLPAELEGEIVALHSDAKRSLVLLVRREGRLQLLVSTDAGKRFGRHPLPFTTASAAANMPLQVQVCRDAVLLINELEPRCAVVPGAFEQIATLARAPAVLSDEEDEAFVYACVPRGDEWLLIRRAAGARSSAPLVIAALGKDVLRDPHSLAVGYAEGGALSVFVAGRPGDPLLRIEASLDSEELA